MKVYIITSEPFPNGMAATNRIKCYAKALIQAEIQCEILVFKRTEIYGKEPKNIYGKGIWESVPYRYMGSTPLRSRNIFVRQINDERDKMALKLYLLANLKFGDIVFGFCGGNVDFVNEVIKIVHKKRAKFVRELCELPYGTSVETHKKKKLRQRTLQKQFPICDGFVAISEELVHLANDYKSALAKVIKIPILVDYEKYDMPDMSSKSKYLYIFHSGTLYEQKDGILGMIQAFGIASMKRPFPIYFVTTGEIEKSPHAFEIKALIKRYNLENKLCFTGYLTDIELKKYLSEASLVIINKYRTQQNRYCFSTKLAEYLAAGKPVIITNVGEAVMWLKNDESAYIVEPENVELLSCKILDAFMDKEKRCNIGMKGKEVAQHSFDYRNYGIIMKDFFMSLYKIE